MTEKPKPNIDWSVTTWKGSRLQQHRAFHALPFARKLEMIEEMSAMVHEFGNSPKTTSSSSTMREDSSSYKTPSHNPSDQQLKPKPRE